MQWELAIEKLFEVRSHALPEVKKIIYNYPATIVIWADGTKTVVKSRKEDYIIPTPYTGFCIAVAKKIYGSTSKLNKIFDERAVYQDDRK